MYIRRSSRPAQVFSRVVLPLTAFVIVVGGIAYLVQNLPNSGTNPVVDVQPATKSLVTFDIPDKNRFVQAVWDNKPDSKYVKEVEERQGGFFDFYFSNASDQDLEASLNQVGCGGCTEATMTVLPAGQTELTGSPTWTLLKSGAQNTVEIGKGSRGVVRVQWKKDVKPQNILHAKVWFQPKDSAATARQLYFLSVPIHIVPPLRFTPEKVDLGDFQGEASGKFECWSATRENMKVAINTKAVDNGFEYAITPMTAAEMEALQKRLEEQDKIFTRVKSAFRVTVHVYESKDGRYLDQGYFMPQIPFLLDNGEEFLGPTVNGYLRPDITIIGADDGRRINLGTFVASSGTPKRKFTLQADQSKLLLLARPADNTVVKLARKKEPGVWDMEVTVPPISFSFDNKGVIVLRSVPIEPLQTVMLDFVGAGPNLARLARNENLAAVMARQTRTIRIPVLGNAVQR